MLQSPMEILELSDGQSAEFHITQYQLDDAIIRPAHAPQGKQIRVLRVHVQPAEKKDFPYYWDITGQGAIAQLLPLLQTGNYQDRLFRVRASGDGPRKRHSVEVV